VTFRWKAAATAVALLAAACTAGTATVHRPAGAAPRDAGQAPARILTIGDSITAGTADGQWQTTVCALMAQYAGRACDIDNVAVAGTGCGYWPAHIAAVLDAYRPDVVTFNCGTNDDAHATLYGESATTWSWRYTVETIHGRYPTALIVPSWIQYSDPLLTWSWPLNDEPLDNDHIYQEITRPNKAGWFPAVADFQQIPATADYLEGACDPAVADCGIHPNARGFQAMGTIEYNAIAVGMGWPSAPQPCGMYGHRRGYPRPTYTPCPGP
jgi:lysophospholipase L1-like esterase